MDKKNRSFVEIKDDKVDNSNDFVVDSLKQYEYVEPKKKFPIKEILMILSIIIIIILMIILFKVLDSYNQSKDTTEKTTTPNSTSKSTTTITTEKYETEEITDTLTCSYTYTENNILFENIFITYFHDKKLRSDMNTMNVTLLNKNNQEDFDNYITILKLVSIELAQDYDSQIEENNEENKYTLAIKTTYIPNQSTDSNVEYDETYESVYQKMLENNYQCN